MSSRFNAAEISYLYDSLEDIRSFVRSAHAHTARLENSIKNFTRTVEAASAYAEAVRIQIGAASVLHSDLAQRAATLNALVSRSEHTIGDNRIRSSFSSVQPIPWASAEQPAEQSGLDLADQATRLITAVQNEQHTAGTQRLPPRFGDRRDTPIVVLDESDNSEDTADAERPSKKVKTCTPSGMPSLRKKRRPVPTSILAYLTYPRTQAGTFSSASQIMTDALFPLPTLPTISHELEPSVSPGPATRMPTPSNSPSDELMDNEADVLMIGDLDEESAQASGTDDNATQVEATN